MTTTTICNGCEQPITPDIVAFTIDRYGPIKISTPDYSDLHLCEECAPVLFGRLPLNTTDRYEQILARLDRVIELLEDIRDARRARIDSEITTLADPERVYLPDVDE